MMDEPPNQTWSHLTREEFPKKETRKTISCFGCALRAFALALTLLILAPRVLSQSPTSLTGELYMGVTIKGDVGYGYTVQYATNGSQAAWTDLATFTLPSSPYLFVDTSTPARANRLYRVYALGNPDPGQLVWIPPGTFTMGSPTNEMRWSAEGPQTVVTLTRGFYIRKNLVTQGDYLSVMGSNPSFFTGDTNHPVESMSWSMATNYCASLTRREQQAGRVPFGWAYRLPTEAEWEYACRAGTTTRYSFGDDPNLTLIGAYSWNSSNSGNTTHPVGTKLPNSWGLYDMHGNLWQFCLDFVTLPGGNVTNFVGTIGGSSHYIRGGAWGTDAPACRSAFRWPSSGGANSIGFRCVLAASP